MNSDHKEEGNRMSDSCSYLLWIKSRCALIWVVLVLFSQILWGLSGAWAAPTISGYSGTVAHNQTVIITGSDFGLKPSSAPVIWDDCSGGNVTDKWDGAWPDSSALPDDSPEYLLPMRGVPLAHSNVTRYLAGCAAGGSEGYPSNVMVWKRRIITSYPAYSYISFYTRVDPLFNSGDNYKWFDYSTGNSPYTADSDDRANWYLEYVGGLGNSHHVNGNGSTIYNQGPDWTVDLLGNSKYFGPSINPKGQWVKIELELKYTPDDDGWFNIYENGKLIKDGPALRSYNGPTDKYNGTDRNEAIGGFSRLVGPDNWRYFNDIYLDWTLSRVVLGNAADHAQCTIREPQVPTAWSEDTITINVNTGKLVAGQTAYLFVIDAEGSVSGGREVTIGGVLPDTTPPSLSSGQPADILAAGTTEAVISVTTNEMATCRWSQTPGTAYGDMTQAFSNTDGMLHTTAVEGLSDGNNYDFYVRCEDSSNNANETDYKITLSVVEEGASAASPGDSSSGCFISTSHTGGE